MLMFQNPNGDFMTALKKMTATLIICGLLASGLNFPLFAESSDKYSFEETKELSFPNDLKLTDALSRPSETQVATSISDDGSQVYLVYNVSFTPGGLLAELFHNSKGQLVTDRTLTLDNNFPVSVGGWASPDFKKFSLLDGVITGLDSLEGRIRILDQNFNVIATRIITFTGIDLASTLVAGGKFSEDGKYLSLSLSNGQPNSTTSFFVFKTSDLSTVAVKNNIPAVNSQPSEWLTLKHHDKKNYYVTFLAGQGFDSQNFEATFQPPYFIQVYKVDFDNATIELIDQSQLPKFAEVDVLRVDNRGLIAHGGFCSLFPNQLSIYDTNFLKTTSLPKDNAEARVLEFDGKKLKVIFKQETNCCNRTVFYPPHKGRTYMVGLNTVTNINGDPQFQETRAEYYVLAKIGCKKGKKQFVPLNLPQQDVTSALPKFSADGKWFIRTGSYGYLNGDPNLDAIGIHNVLLFKVI